MIPLIPWTMGVAASPRETQDNFCTVISCPWDTGGDVRRQFMAKLRPCLSYSPRRGRINSVPNSIQYEL